MVASSEEIGIGLLLLIGYGWRRESKRFISASPIATKGAALRGGPRRIDTQKKGGFRFGCRTRLQVITDRDVQEVHYETNQHVHIGCICGFGFDSMVPERALTGSHRLDVHAN